MYFFGFQFCIFFGFRIFALSEIMVNIVDERVQEFDLLIPQSAIVDDEF